MSTRPPISPLYACYLSPAEKSSLRRVPLDNISSEINLLRVLHALLMSFQLSAPPDIYSRIHTLHTFVILNHQLACLVRWHDRKHSPLDEMEAEIQAAISSMGDEWKLA